MRRFDWNTRSRRRIQSIGHYPVHFRSYHRPHSLKAAMDADSFLATSFVSSRKTKMGSAGRTPPRIRTKRTTSVSSGSSASIASPTSPTLVTPQHFSVARQRVPPPRLNLAGSSKIYGDDVCMADGEDTALGDLTRVLMVSST
jgi:hypothetical protein